MSGRRSSKWYNKNEKEVMERFGLVPTKRSGAGWIEKEDGYNEFILCQHKSTDAESYRLKLDDMDKLEYHANVDHKTPVFIVQFLQTDEIFLVLKPENFHDVYNYLNLPKSSLHGRLEPCEQSNEPEERKEKRLITSSTKGMNKLIEIQEGLKNESSKRWETVIRTRGSSKTKRTKKG